MLTLWYDSGHTSSVDALLKSGHLRTRCAIAAPPFLARIANTRSVTAAGGRGSAELGHSNSPTRRVAEFEVHSPNGVKPPMERERWPCHIIHMFRLPTEPALVGLIVFGVLCLGSALMLWLMRILE